MQIQINNLPMDYKKYVVAMLIDNNLWYWGSWDDKSKAEQVAKTMPDGVVIEMDS